MASAMLVTATWLAEHLSDPAVRVVDVRWYLAEPDRGQVEYHAGHIPGASFLHMDRELSAPRGSGPGRHPLPTPEDFAMTASAAGIGPETLVVAYDSSGGMAAARLWWLLRYFGHERVALLDGGWQAWLAAGGATESDVPAITPSRFVAQPRAAMVVDAAAVEQLRHNAGTRLLDARAAERYEGKVEPIDPQAGHIPGAVSAPYGGNLAADGSWLPAEALQARYAALGVSDGSQVVCYCGSGVSAAHDIFALELAGHRDALLYEGSWSDWSSDPSRPVATGPEPGA